MTPVEKKNEALRKAMKQFLFYADQHEAKGTMESAIKATTNREMAEICKEALAA